MTVSKVSSVTEAELIGALRELAAEWRQDPKRSNGQIDDLTHTATMIETVERTRATS